MVPSRVAFFAWTAVLGKTLTLDNVRKRGIVVINRCCMCESEGESIDHLFLHCGVARILWNALFTRFGLCWVMPGSIKELYATWWAGGKSRSAVMWKMIPLCLMLCIWNEEMLDVSRTHLGTLRTLFTSSCTPFSLGLLAG